MNRGVQDGKKRLALPDYLGVGDPANDGKLLQLDSTQPGGVKVLPLGTYVDTTPPASLTFYVAPWGSDSANKGQDWGAPFATLYAAVAAITAAGVGGAVYIAPNPVAYTDTRTIVLPSGGIVVKLLGPGTQTVQLENTAGDFFSIAADSDVSLIVEDLELITDSGWIFNQHARAIVVAQFLRVNCYVKNPSYGIWNTTADGVTAVEITALSARDCSWEVQGNATVPACNWVTTNAAINNNKFDGCTFTQKRVQRADAGCGTTNGSPTVTDTAATGAEVGWPVFGTNIPASTYVGTATAGVGFTLSSSPTSNVPVTATGTGTVTCSFYEVNQGAPFFHIESYGAGHGWLQGWSFDDCKTEECNGGFLWGGSLNAPIIKNLQHFDLAAPAVSGIVLTYGTSNTSAPTIQAVILGGSGGSYPQAAGIYNVDLQHTTNTHLIGATGSINLNSLATPMVVGGNITAYNAPANWPGPLTTGLGNVISDQTLASPGSFTVSSIPQTYADLEITVYARSTRASTTIDSCTLSFNGDAVDANYDVNYIRGNGGASTSGQLNATAGARVIGLIPPGQYTAGIYGVLKITIPNYANANFHKQALCTGGVASDTAAQSFTEQRIEHWRSAAAIASFVLAGVSGSLDTGSRVVVRGLSG